MRISRPSPAFRVLRRAVQSGLVKRGYARLFRLVPSVVWGGDSLEVETRVGRMVLSVREPSVVPLLIWGDIRMEHRESAFIEAWMRNVSGVALDIGAHVGWYTRLMARDVQQRDSMEKRRAHVYAFEPNPVVFPYLRETVKDLPCVSVHPVAVTSRWGRLEFYCAESANLSSVVRAVGKSVIVDGIALDQFCTEVDILGDVSFVKCDVEGGELDVLRGARELRTGSPPPVWMVEVAEVFLQQAGVTANALTIEIAQGTHPANIFYLDAHGVPVKVSHVSERSGTSNIFIVPKVRIPEFLEVTELARVGR